MKNRLQKSMCSIISSMFKNTYNRSVSFYLNMLMYAKIRQRSVQFSHSVVSDSLQPHGLQHLRLPCPSPTPGAYSNSLSIALVMPSNHLILSFPSPALSLFQHQVFSNESVLCIRWPEYWSFRISPSSE